MKELGSLNKKQLHKHIIAWILIIIYINLNNPLSGTLSVKVVGSGLINLNYMFVFYSFRLFIFPKFWEGKWLLLILFAITCLIIFWTNFYIICVYIIPSLGGKSYYQSQTLFYYLGDSLFFFTISASAGTASFFNSYGLYKLKLQTNKEKYLLVKELDYLKNQFNSHITFNFLNYCYSKLHIKSPKIADSIELFSDILRYNLRTKPDVKVALVEEITYINNFITLQKYLNTDVQVNFSYIGEIDNIFLFPHILPSLVENAFINGIYNDIKYPILINLNSVSTKLNFVIKYHVNSDFNIVSKNIEFENVKQILDLYYHDCYTLISKMDEDYFRVELSIQDKI